RPLGKHLIKERPDGGRQQRATTDVGANRQTIHVRCHLTAVNPIIELLSHRRSIEGSGLSESVVFETCVKERLVLEDGPAKGAAKLISNQVVLHARCIREPIICRQSLNAIVFKG